MLNSFAYLDKMRVQHRNSKYTIQSIFHLQDTDMPSRESGSIKRQLFITQYTEGGETSYEWISYITTEYKGKRRVSNTIRI